MPSFPASLLLTCFGVTTAREIIASADKEISDYSQTIEELTNNTFASFQQFAHPNNFITPQTAVNLVMIVFFGYLCRQIKKKLHKIPALLKKLYRLQVATPRNTFHENARIIDGRICINQKKIQAILAKIGDILSAQNSSTEKTEITRKQIEALTALEKKLVALTIELAALTQLIELTGSEELNKLTTELTELKKEIAESRKNPLDCFD